MKDIITAILVAIMGVVGLVYGTLALQGYIDKQYCECMGRQTYIMTRYNEGRCLMNVLSYEELDIVQYLFICEGGCR